MGRTQRGGCKRVSCPEDVDGNDSGAVVLFGREEKLVWVVRDEHGEKEAGKDENTEESLSDGDRDITARILCLKSILKCRKKMRSETNSLLQP